MDLTRPIARGNTAEIYLFEDKIFKVYHDGFSDSGAEYEANKQRTAYYLGLPVPQIFSVTRIGGRPAIIMEYVQGITIGDLMWQDEENAEAYLAHSVDIQVDMHTKSATGLESMEDKLVRQIQKAAILSVANRATLLKRLSKLPMENKLCHGDFHVFNLIKTENKTDIIDWGDSSIGNPCADAYRSYLLYLQSSTYLAERYLQLYCKKSGLSHNDIISWAPIVAGARLSENVSPGAVDPLLNIILSHL